jgi:hypothetical protein
MPYRVRQRRLLGEDEQEDATELHQTARRHTHDVRPVELTG